MTELLDINADDLFRIYVHNELYEFLDQIKSCDKNPRDNELISVLKNLAVAKVISPADKNDLLYTISQLLLSNETALTVISYFTALLPELFLRCKHFVTKRQEPKLIERLLQSCLLSCHFKELSKVITSLLHWICKNEEYFGKMKRITYLCFKLIFYLRSTGVLSDDIIVDLKQVISCTQVQHLQTKWLAYKLLGSILKITDIDSYLKEHFTVAEYQLLLNEDLTTYNDFKVIEKIIPLSKCDSNSKIYFDQTDFTGTYIPVNGVLLECSLNEKLSFGLNVKSSIVFTKTFLKNSKSVVNAVQANLPILLAGEIGCGKTVLIEYLSAIFGRTEAPAFLKLQLGDQTDSKSLLGTYICSDKPGEFKWQPGTLTQAVQNGSWVLLEDIDTAPPDVISTLTAMVKSKCLSIPGHTDGIAVSPDFQLFTTTRLGQHTFLQNQSSTMHLFSRLCYQINISNPDKEELIQIVRAKLPNLSTVAYKMVDVFCMVSADKSLEAEDDISNHKLALGSRKSTPRDLLKWCARTSDFLRNSGEAPAQEHIFLNALHCFCSSVDSYEDRAAVAFSIGAKLGLTKEKVEYYLTKYKPTISNSDAMFQVGSIKIMKNLSKNIDISVNKQKFAFTQHSLRLIENIAEAVVSSEPVLLVGETGCGKTSCVQFLAQQCRKTVNVVNMSQQSDLSDLLGGFKPMDLKQIVRPVKESFVELFVETYSKKQNVKFLGHIDKCYMEKKWSTLVKLVVHCCKKAITRKQKDDEYDENYADLNSRWQSMSIAINNLEKKIAAQDGLVFHFVEGALVKAIKSGEWILLDEINLATAETLECLSGLLDSQSGSMVLTERGDIEPIKRHENFRLFACMNPATDVGKKDLPYGIRNRFTEIYVDEIRDENDLKTLVAFYLKDMSLSSSVIEGIVRFYQRIGKESKESLMDSSGHRPHFSLRTLCRGLEYAVNQSSFSPLRAVYEGLSMSFLTQLDRPSHPIVVGYIKKFVFDGVRNIASILSQPLHRPKQTGVYVNVQGYWLTAGTEKTFDDKCYVLTESVKKNLKDLARVVAGRRYPVLLQGETSVGKTSLITYLSRVTGNHCVRINNHEHTDIQEYIGCYGADDNGNLVFKEGVLVTAMRKGYWIILDELNLAPTDVLEALNRLLDDNRELFIAETQETVKAHPSFMLFATQNPPGHYGGRKMLSRAFRNRFVELHFDEIPSKELQEILHRRCHLPESYCKKFVKVMLDLQVRRRNTGIFAGKNSFMTLRDLFRWAERYRLSTAESTFHDWEQCICEDGFMLIAGRCRQEDESQLIKEVLEQNFKKTIDTNMLFDGTSLATQSLSRKLLDVDLDQFKHIVWTRNMKRLAILAGRALEFGEAVLLVGETGCGKTTICQIYSESNKRKLYAVNCHMHTESADFLGGLRPVRSKDVENQKLFEWCDGPLVNAMNEGEMFLIDEISLADDSVLERLNSVLETDRILVLSEKGELEGKKGSIDIIKAKDSFRLVATMNPGGDFGKKELSPALRNRFTEIWCSPSDSYEDLKQIIELNIKDGVKLSTDESNESGFGHAIVEFLKWFRATDIGSRFTISIRDLLSWIEFINLVCVRSHASNMEIEDSTQENRISAAKCYVHGACLVFIDAIGSGNTSQLTGFNAEDVKTHCMRFLMKQVGLSEFDCMPECQKNLECFGIGPFFIPKGPIMQVEDSTYTVNAKTTLKNALHLLRGLQLARPILLEGSPGVGKTSLVMAVARMSGNPITRINLSEETDVSDLFGADLPVEGEEGGMFAWRDGPLLKALKAGHWVVFDELNLASQSVLEGLNACFDHRAEIYVPELNKSFQVKKDQTKIFACQNPLREGGGRKGLPKSFLNRFTKVYVDAMTSEDYFLIISQAFKSQSTDNIKKMIKFNELMQNEVVEEGLWGRKGSPWEFNVRDMMRWCELLENHNGSQPADFVSLLYQDRMRTMEDKDQVFKAYERVFGDHDIMCRQKTRLCNFVMQPTNFQVGNSKLDRKERSVTIQGRSDQYLLRSMLPVVESVMKCIEMNWLAILVGSESYAKNNIIQTLSQMSSNKLSILSMNSGMDTSDFIGGFEQVNPTFEFQQSCSEIMIIIDTFTSKLINHVDGNIIDNLLATKSKIALLRQGCDTNFQPENLLASLKKYLNGLKACTDLLNEEMSDYDEIMLSLFTIYDDMETRIMSGIEKAGQFQWVNGVLVEALLNGHWLLIDNVNLCSSAILDRLNALLEPNGVLTIDERGVIDGAIPTVKPHKDFRLFMSLDPHFGEVSRAMRNRGVEIFIPTETDGVVMDKIDLSLMMQSKQLLDKKAQDLIITTHDLYKQQQPTVKYSKLLQAAELTSSLLTRGVSTENAVCETCIEIYGSDENTDTIRQELKNLILTKSDDVNKVYDLVGRTSHITSYLSTREATNFLRDSIPLMLTDKQSLIKTITAVLLFVERTSLSDMNVRLEMLKKCCHLSNIDASNALKLFPIPQEYHDASLTLKEAFSVENVHLCSFGNRFYFMLIQVLKGLFDQPIPSKHDTILSTSIAFTQGVIPANLLQHKSLMFISKLFDGILDFIKTSLLSGVILLSERETFVKMELSFVWFQLFYGFCKLEMPQMSLSSTSFSLSELSLHWKWFVDKFMISFDASLLSSEVTILIKQLQILLGNDVTCDTLNNVTNAIGRAFGWKFKEQPVLLCDVSDLYKKVGILQLEETRTIEDALLLLYTHIFSTDVYTSDLTLKIQALHGQVNEVSLKTSKQTQEEIAAAESSAVDQLYSLACYEMVYGATNERFLTNIENLLNYGKRQNLQQYSLINIMQNGVDVNSLLPHLKLNLYQQLSPNLSAMFIKESMTNLQTSQLPVSYCASILSLLLSLTKTKNGDQFELQISLVDYDNMKMRLDKLQETLWVNMTQIMNVKKDLSATLNKIAYGDISAVINALITTYDLPKDWLLCMDFTGNDLSNVMKKFVDADLPKMIADIMQCWLQINETILKEHQLDCMNEAGVHSIVAGLLTAQVTRPYLKYDPIEEVKKRLECFQNQLSDVNTELQVRFDAEYIWCGANIPDVSNKELSLEHHTSNEERVLILISKRKLLIHEIESITTQQSIRPDQSQYTMLYQDFNHFFDSVGKVPNILQLLHDAVMLLITPFGLKVKREKIMNLLRKIKQWLNSMQIFINKIKNDYPLYNDITLVCCTSLQQCHNGFQLLLESLQQKIVKPANSKIFESLITLPSSTSLMNCEMFSADPMLLACKKIAEQHSDAVFKKLPINVLQFAMISFADHTSRTTLQFQSEKESFNKLFQKLLHDNYQLWCHEKQMKLEKAAETEALYKFKSQVQCETKTEEEELEEMQKELFPSFDKEFEDLLPTDVLNQDVVNTESTNVHKKNDDDVLNINETFIYDLVRAIYLKKPSQVKDDEFVRQAFNYGLAMLKLQEIHLCCDYEKIAPSVLTYFSNLQHDMSKEISSTFNIYTDHNIVDAIKCRKILNDFHVFVKQLLKEYEEHPALIQIEQVILRLMSFSIYSPVMKFVTGFEFLLKQAQNWETYASSHVSLRKHLEIITTQVIEWRKAELKSWPLLLDRAEKKQATSVSKYFFHFYNLLEEMKNNGAEGFEAFETSVKQFLEQSTVGEFEARLEMIDLILCHFKLTNVSSDIQDSIWNVMMYYKQFVKVITDHKDTMKKPIEKELKDYVKIARWNDINFYAMKQAVEKSHRTLNKFVRRFETVLREPIQQFLQNVKTISQHVSSIHIKTSKEFIFTPSTEYKQVDVSDVHHSDLCMEKLNKLCGKMKKHVTTVCKNMNHSVLIENLDGLTGDLIEGIQELQKEDISSLPKEKQKSARNNLQQRKRKALSSLFKELKGLGVSYRKGLTILETIGLSRNIPTIDVKCSNDQDSLLEALDSGNRYFFASMARQSAFDVSLCSPSKEIGPAEIIRFKGISSHLFDLCCQQRQMLGSVLTLRNEISDTRTGLQETKDSINKEILAPPQEITRDTLLTLKKLVDKSLHVFQYTKSLLLSAPKRFSGTPMTPFDSSRLPQVAGCSLEDEILTSAVEQLNVASSCIEKIKTGFANLKINEDSFALLNWRHWHFTVASISKLEEISSSLKDVVTLLSTSSQTTPCLADQLIELQKDIHEKHSHILSLNHQESSLDITDEVIMATEDAIKKLLLPVQNLKNLSVEFKEILQKAQEEDQVMLNGHLFPILSKHFFTQIQQLNLKNINHSIITLVSTLQRAFNDGYQTSSMIYRSVNIYSLLHEYEKLIGYFLHHLSMLHRTTSKLLYVLYGLFTDLLQQGYCIPPEDDDGMVGEGATEFEDIENGGLGEGQGAKDVSDQIESQDQVEDTKHEKSEEKDEQNNDEDDIKEEKDGIEMSDDFDSKLQDLELNSDDENSEDEDDGSDNEADKQMGDVDEQDEILDEKMWGDEDDDDDEEEDKKEKEEEKGEGADGKTESQLVAKDENEGEQEGDANDEKKPSENEEHEINEQEEIEDEKQPENEEVSNDRNKSEQNIEDIPDDLNLDGDDDDNDDDKEKEMDDENDDEDDDDDENGDEIENEMEADMKEMGEDDNETEEDSENNKDDDKDDTIKADNETEEEENETEQSDQDKSTLPEEATSTSDNVEQLSDDVDMQTTNTATEQQQQNEQDDKTNQTGGQADNEGNDAQHGDEDSLTNRQADVNKGRKRKDLQRSREDRTLEKNDVSEAKKRKALDVESNPNDGNDNDESRKDTDSYQHLQDENAKHDELTIDSATQEQLSRLDHQQQFSQQDEDMDDNDDDDEENDDVLKSEVKDTNMDKAKVKPEDIHAHKPEEQMNEKKNELVQEEGVESMESDDDLSTIAKSEFFTDTSFLNLPLTNLQERDSVLQKLRHQLEEDLISLSVNRTKVVDERSAMELWMKYENLTSALAQQLCEQLRLVLEPTLASKMRGDYRTGKRLNMRKVIPYIASQFRKDKIWLRRTKKSKRQYQIMMAIDDSSSMADNHSKQLAFESLAVISNALRWLEAGDLAVCSFGEEARMIHSFDEPFSEHAGASILQQFTFEQKKTKIAQLLNMATVLFDDFKSRGQHSRGTAVSQLLLIVSDGRGIFLEGKEVVKRASQQAREAGIFTVFLILDDPKNRDSILDIKVPIFKPDSALPEIKSYIEEFPFPYYLLLRDINSLPNVLSDALKQWFELVTQAT